MKRNEIFKGIELDGTVEALITERVEKYKQAAISAYVDRKDLMSKEDHEALVRQLNEQIDVANNKLLEFEGKDAETQLKEKYLKAGMKEKHFDLLKDKLPEDLTNEEELKKFKETYDFAVDAKAISNPHKVNHVKDEKQEKDEKPKAMVMPF